MSSRTPQRGRADDPSETSSQRDAPSQSQLPEWVIDPEFGGWTFPKDDSSDLTIRRFLQYVWMDIVDILKNDPKLREHLADKEEFIANVKRKGDRDFIKSLKGLAESRVWAPLFEDEVFLKPKLESKSEIEQVNKKLVEATELAWNNVFQGNAEHVLLETIADLLDKKRTPYARLTSIVNSSGTGKSRIVDQLGMTIITVPMCLRPEGSQGFPPPDDNLRHWLIFGGPGASSDNQRRLQGFAYSLLVVTLIELEKIVEQGNDVPQLPDLGNMNIQDMSKTEREGHVESTKMRQAWLASTFRDRMTSGQTFGTTNKYRTDFYNDVVQSVNKFMERSVPVIRENKSRHPQFRYGHDGVADAGERLCRFVDPHDVLDSNNGPRRPLVVFAFDEAHTLTNNPPGAKWNSFLELCRALREIHDLPIFSLFISTAGRFNLFSSEIRSDPSNRIRDASLCSLDPISEVCFDDVAYRAFEDTVTLDRVVQMDWIAHLGRPLFGSRWDAMHISARTNEAHLMDFAKHKLLDGKTALANDDRPGSLACLSVRFALEFCMDGTARNVAYAQVERHMRLCVAATTGSDKLVTVAGSEPLLAEAAYQLMKVTHTNAVHHLAHHSDLNCIDRGRRGELVAALIIMHASDVARARRASLVDRRWVTVVEFMKALLPPSDYDTLRISGPTFWRAQEDRSFEETFQGYGMWFNHVIKVEESEMISASNLWKFITRGAMVLCSNNQEGIDILLPVCDTKRELSCHSVTAILIQVKNAKRYKKDIDKTLFDGMDPLSLSIFPKSLQNAPLATDIPKPVIRLVFALTSPEAGVVFRQRAERRNHPDPFTAFDIWLAGLSASTFGQVGEDLAPHQILLDRSLRPHDAFELKDDPSVGDEARKLRGLRRQRMAPLSFSGPAYEAIHRPETFTVTPVD